MKEELLVISSILSGVGTMITAYFAYKGIHMWKNQMNAHNNVELAKKILKKAYETEEAIEQFRQEISKSEYPKEQIIHSRISKKEEMSESQILKYVYSQRLEVLCKTIFELRELTVEGKIHWDEGIIVLYQPIISILNLLKKAVKDIIESPNENSDTNYKKVLFSTENDEIKQLVKYAISNYERVLNPIVRENKSKVKLTKENKKVISESFNFIKIMEKGIK